MVKLVHTPWTAIVSPEQFERVQERIRNRQTGPGQKKQRTGKVMLGGLVECKCGNVMWAGSSRGRRTFACTGHRYHNSCDETTIPMEVVETAVLQEMLSIFAEDDTIEDEFLRMATEAAQSNAVRRGMEREEWKLKLAEATRDLDKKMAADIPNDPDVKEAWDRAVEALARAKREAREMVARSMPSISVIEVTGAKIATMRQRLQRLIGKVPLVGKDEEQIRLRAHVRSIVRKVKFERVDERTANASILFNFNEEFGLDDDDAVFERVVRMDVATSFRQRREVTWRQLEEGYFRPTPEQCARLDECRFLRMALRTDSRREKRHLYYEAMFAMMESDWSADRIGAAVGLNRGYMHQLLRDIPVPGDAKKLADLLKRLRGSNLDYDHTRFQINSQNKNGSFQRRYDQCKHPLRLHPLASVADSAARMSDEEFDAVWESLPTRSYFRRQEPLLLRAMVDGLLWMLRTDNGLPYRPIELRPNYEVVRTSSYDLLNGRDGRAVATALLEHAGIFSPGAKLVLPYVAPFSKRGRERDLIKGQAGADGKRPDRAIFDPATYVTASERRRLASGNNS